MTYNRAAEPLPEFKQPKPFVQFQVVKESGSLYPSIYALDTEGKLWFRRLSPRKGHGWIPEELAGEVE
jgi:hypothetical protein